MNFTSSLSAPSLTMGMFFTTSPCKVCESSHNIIIPSPMEKLESIQYTAAFAVTGTWRGTSRDKLYAELGWETLSARKWSRRLTLFYKIIDNLTPFLYKGSTSTTSSVAILSSKSGGSWVNSNKNGKIQI